MTATRIAFALALGAAAGLGAGYWWWHAPSHAAAPPAAGDEGGEPGHAAVVSGPGHVALDGTTVMRLGIATAPLANATAAPTLTAPGRLIADPATSAAVRAPFAGRLVPGPQPLPTFGAAVTAGQTIALLQPLLSVAERADLAVRRAQAASDLAAARAAEVVAARELERTRALHADGNTASQRAVDQAEAEHAAVAARIEAAAAALALLPTDDGAPVPLPAPIAGRVVGLGARLGEAVDAGATVLQIAEPTRCLARITVPAPADVAATFAGARVELLGDEKTTVDATFVAWVDAGGADRALLLAIAGGADRPPLLPGRPVVAPLPRRGAPPTAGDVAVRALVRRGDGVWLWLRTGVDDKAIAFQRVPLTLIAPTADGWLATSPDAAFVVGAEAVVTGAATLLSCERASEESAEGGG